MKKGFTLAEVLIVLIVIGIIATLSVGVFNNGGFLPDRNKVLFKKAYSVVERIAGELVNDESIYAYDPNSIGFRNTALAEGEFEGERKFCNEFARKLNIIGSAGNEIFNERTKLCSFETTDGIKWTIHGGFVQGTSVPCDESSSIRYYDGGCPARCVAVGPRQPIYNCGGAGIACRPTYKYLCRCAPTPEQLTRCRENNEINDTLDEAVVIKIDVKGDNGNNIAEADLPRYRLDSADFSNENRDSYFVYVYADGRVTVPPGSIEAEYLRSHSAN